MILNYAYWYGGHGFEMHGMYKIASRIQSEDIFTLMNNLNLNDITQINYTSSESNTTNVVLDSFFIGLTMYKKIFIRKFNSLLLLTKYYGRAVYAVRDKTVNIITNGKKHIIDHVPYGYIVDGSISHTNSICENKLYLLVDKWKEYEV